MSLYPQAVVVQKVALDSEEAALTRMLAAMESIAGCTKPEAIAVGLNGSDDVATVERLYQEIIDERATLEAVPLDDEILYTAAVTAVANLLDPVKWVQGKKAVMGGVLSKPVE